jgi:predicted solute-binding protein
MIAIIRKLPSQKVAEFQTAIANAKNLTEQKRFIFPIMVLRYAREVILGQEEVLRPRSERR